MSATPAFAAQVLATHALVPPLRHSAEDVERAFMQWLSGQDRELRVRAQRVLRNAGVDGRNSFLPLDEIFAERPLDAAEGGGNGGNGGGDDSSWWLDDDQKQRRLRHGGGGINRRSLAAAMRAIEQEK